MQYGDYISVLLPTYNCAAYLRSAVQSILDQSYRKFELLILDDGSTDETEQVVAAFQDDRIRYIKKERTGLGATLNHGLSLARHTTVARMDADDVAHPERFEKQVRFLSEHPEVGVLSSWYATFSGSGILYVIRTAERHQDIVDRLYLHSEIVHPGCMFKKETIVQAEGYTNTVAQDYELWNRLRNTVQFANIPEVLTFVRYNRASHSRKSFSKRDETIRSIQKRYYGIPTNKDSTITPLSDYRYGWQEYFYGNKRTTRTLWSGSNKWKNFRTLLAYLSTFLPDALFVQFKEARSRLRLEYLYRFPAKEKVALQNVLRRYVG